MRLNFLLRRDNRLSTLLFENSQANLKQLQLSQKDLHKFLIGENGIFLFDLLASWASVFFALSSRLGDEPIVHAVKNALLVLLSLSTMASPGLFEALTKATLDQCSHF